MTITVTRNFTLKGFKFATKDDMEAIGRLARERIIRRTVMGQAPGGGAFEPYSEGYRARKAKELGSASPVNLQVSGEMLRGIQIVATDTDVTLTFNT